jgi:hypothetical protein
MKQSLHLFGKHSIDEGIWLDGRNTDPHPGWFGPAPDVPTTAATALFSSALCVYLFIILIRYQFWNEQHILEDENLILQIHTTRSSNVEFFLPFDSFFCMVGLLALQLTGVVPAPDGVSIYTKLQTISQLKWSKLRVSAYFIVHRPQDRPLENASSSRRDDNRQW